MTVEEGNKLIAEFMGDKSMPHLYDYLVNCFYNSKWDWLISAIAKIKEVTYRCKYDNDDDLLTYKNAKSRLAPILNELQNIDITNTHFCVVKFIEWYNSTLTNKTIK